MNVPHPSRTNELQHFLLRRAAQQVPPGSTRNLEGRPHSQAARRPCCREAGRAGEELEHDELGNEDAAKEAGLCQGRPVLPRGVGGLHHQGPIFSGRKGNGGIHVRVKRLRRGKRVGSEAVQPRRGRWETRRCNEVRKAQRTTMKGHLVGPPSVAPVVPPLPRLLVLLDAAGPGVGVIPLALDVADPPAT